MLTFGLLALIPHGYLKSCHLCGTTSIWWDVMTPPKEWPASDCRGCFGGVEDEPK